MISMLSSYYYSAMVKEYDLMIWNYKKEKKTKLKLSCIVFNNGKMTKAV